MPIINISMLVLHCLPVLVNGCNLISRQDFPGGYALYAFDLTADQCEGNHLNLLRHGTVRVDMKFAQLLPNTINVIAFAEFENILEIDRSRNVLFDYKN